MSPAAPDRGYHGHPVDQILALHTNASSPLFDRFPGLRGRLPWIPIGTFPTPMEPLPLMGLEPGTCFVKRDELTSSVYGGNKVRKLEHVLADARLCGSRSLMTLGALGSHQCLATALHGRSLGFEVDLCLFDQPLTDHVRAVLAADLAAGGQLVYGRGYVPTVVKGLGRWIERRWRGFRPYFIPIGATTPLGSVGYVTAGLELATQVAAGAMPRPDRIFIAAGSNGSIAGLLVGLRLGGLETRCVAVQVATRRRGIKWYIRRLAQRTHALLRALDASVPDVTLRDEDFDLETGFLGAGYGHVTSEGLEACDAASPVVRLETTYTGKALAALRAYGREVGRGQVLLFWNTYDEGPLEVAADLEALPTTLRSRVALGLRKDHQ